MIFAFQVWIICTLTFAFIYISYTANMLFQKNEVSPLEMFGIYNAVTWLLVYLFVMEYNIYSWTKHGIKYLQTPLESCQPSGAVIKMTVFHHDLVAFDTFKDAGH